MHMVELSDSKMLLGKSFSDLLFKCLGTLQYMVAFSLVRALNCWFLQLRPLLSELFIIMWH